MAPSRTRPVLPPSPPKTSTATEGSFDFLRFDQMSTMQNETRPALVCSVCADAKGLSVQPPCSLHDGRGEAVYKPAGPERFLYEDALSGDSIRLILIEAGSGDQGIRCRLSVESLYTQQRYTAVSYVWGDASARRNITCNGTPLSITENLHEVLYWLCEDGQTHQPIWVDAVYINQANTAEKTEQIHVMRKIYKQASLVLSWLGNPEDEAENEMGFQMLRSIHDRLGSSVTIEDLNRPRFDSVAELGLPVPVNSKQSAE